MGDAELRIVISRLTSPWTQAQVAPHIATVGKGEHFLNNSGVLSQIVGGWSNSSSFTINSGSPQTVWASGNQAFGGVKGWPFANCVGNPKGPKTSREWFNTNDFSDPGNYQLGDCARDSLYGPGQWDLDTALMKTFPVRELAKIQFRADAFNVFNHCHLSQPNSSFEGETLLER